MNKKPIVAIMYDFDKTLSVKDMQEYSFIPSLNMTAKEFWSKADELAYQNEMDYMLAYMLLTVQKAKEAGVDVSRNALKKHGETVQFNKGVEDWFDRINAYGDSLGVEVRHYVISCGLKPMIEGTKIGDKFTNVFACDFVYDGNGNPLWPAMAINYTSKVQFLYRINKGVENIAEHRKLNMRTPSNQRAVYFSNMIYVGDGLTDVPSMKLTRLNGGYSIGVYQKAEDSKYLVDEDRVDFYVKADYSDGSEMDVTMKAILHKIATSNALHTLPTFLPSDRKEFAKK